MNPVMLFAAGSLGSLSAAEKMNLLKGYPEPADFMRLSRFELEWHTGRRCRMRSFIPSEILKKAEEDLKRTDRSGISWCWYGSEEYPDVLKNIYDPPFLLFYRGTLPPRHADALAVVGTRRPSLGADRGAFCLGAEAGAAGIPLISGLARGIDEAAHRGVAAAKGRTWSVLGTGCDRVYPSCNRDLAARILDLGGGIISEFTPGTAAARYNFPKRNRIISGLSGSVVIVQAPARSGALYTADFALDQGRDVLVHRAGLTGSRGAGSAALADDGAQIISSLKDVFPGAFTGSFSNDLPAEGRLRQGASVEDAAAHAAGLMDREMEESLIFYKGRVQL